MNQPTKFSRIVDGLRYDVAKATLLASDVYWDGHNMERNGRNQFLYRTANGRYFTVVLTKWQGERDELTPVSEDDARLLYEGALTEHEISYREAFPNVTIQDA